MEEDRLEVAGIIVMAVRDHRSRGSGVPYVFIRLG